jgi:hypothetical protein
MLYLYKYYLPTGYIFANVKPLYSEIHFFFCFSATMWFHPPYLNITDNIHYPFSFRFLPISTLLLITMLSRAVLVMEVNSSYGRKVVGHESKWRVVFDSLRLLSVHNCCTAPFPLLPRNNARGLFSVRLRNFGLTPPHLFSSFSAAAPV